MDYLFSDSKLIHGEKGKISQFSILPSLVDEYGGITQALQLGLHLRDLFQSLHHENYFICFKSMIIELGFFPLFCSHHFSRKENT